ncbi:MAG: glucose-1-phosphate adenylyltransferase [Clostridia bacterium]|nr:glucose-1-phosphate adenylyltransferase [Clostridia bacterium]
MYKKKECVAMLLAGGQGSRLYTLTEKTAKPAVPFGAKYRIIDFTLSNCVNSHIDTVGVLTQYQPLVLNEYIGNGQPWDLDRMNGGVMVLPPYQGKDGADWYRGTANAIYQNLNFINRYDPDYVLVLSGDHIYKMDYSKMLDYHKKMNAAATIAVIDVPLEQASRFGIMNTDEDGKIIEFEEKPPKPKSTKASMGIYIFNKKLLENYLIADENNPDSVNDFGKNIIPAMLASGESMYAYSFSGYWKDVGTIESLWEAHMDLLGDEPVFNLFDSDWKIYSRNLIRSPHYIGGDAKVMNSIITEGCEVHGVVENSVLFGGVKVARGAYIRNSIIMNDTVIREGASVYYSIIDGDTEIGAGAQIGEVKESGKGITLVGSDLTIPHGTVIPAGDMVNAAYLDEKLKA